MNKNDINLIQLIEQETGMKFNRSGKICCPLPSHKDKTPSFSVKDNKFTCYGCGSYGDSIDFIRHYKGLDYVEACKYLGIELDGLRMEVESKKDKVISYANWMCKNFDNLKDGRYSVSELYPFVNEDGVIEYYKVKFKSEIKGMKKEVKYFHFNGDKVEAKRGGIEIPYNLFNLRKAMFDRKIVFIVEGEKDCETLKGLGYVAASFKGVTEFDWSRFSGAKVFMLSDTGEAGEDYKDHIWYAVKDYVSEFNVVELTGLKKLGDNKDVTDWIALGNSKDDFKRCLKEAWDYKKNRKFRCVEAKYDKHGNFTGWEVLKIWENFKCVLENNKIDIKYNDLSRRIEQNISDTENNFYADMHSIANRSGFKISKQDARDFAIRTANDFIYSPVQEYLNNCYSNYDGNDHLEKFYETLECTEEFPIEAKKLYMRKMLANAVNIAFNNGNTNTEGMLTLQGKQGLGKTRWTSKLSPLEGTVKTGKMINPDNKDNILETTGYWFTEIGELESTLKGDLSKIKAFITEGVDELRRPYAMASERYPRRTVFIATVNSADFLKDETGNRRYWVLPLVKINHDLMDEIDLDQLYGQMMHMIKSEEEVHYFKPDELDILANNNKAFNYKNSICLTLEDLFNQTKDEFDGGETVFTISELCKLFFKNECKKSVSNTLKLMGYESKVHKVNGKSKRGYKLPIASQCWTWTKVDGEC